MSNRPLKLKAPLPQVEILRRVRAAAVEMNEDPRTILREVKDGTPTGRFVLKLLGLPTQDVRPGRPPDSARVKAIHKVVQELRRSGKTEAQAFKDAPEILARNLRQRTNTSRDDAEKCSRGVSQDCDDLVGARPRVERERKLSTL